MIIRRNVYKRISIISFTIVLIMITSLIAPIFTKAEEANYDILINFEDNTKDGIVIAKGHIPEGFNKYELYWANKEYNEEIPAEEEKIQEFVTNTLNWFKDNKLAGKDVETVEGNREINSNALFNKGAKYSVLCVVYDNDGIAMLSWANHTATQTVEKEAERITLKLKNNDKKITISAADDSAKMTKIKIKKSSNAMKVADFETDEITSLDFNQTNKVTITTTVEEYGVYYVYAENEQGYKVVDGIAIKEPEQKSNVDVKIYKITDENYGDVAISVTSNPGVITAIKYCLSDERLNVNEDSEESRENRNRVKNDGTPMNVNGNLNKEEIVKSDGELTGEKYITVYVQSKVGETISEYWFEPGKIDSLSKIDIAPWENEPIIEEPETEKTQKEETKTEEPKKEEARIEEPKKEESKAEESKKEQIKSEDSKKEEAKVEETNKNETKVEEPKREEAKVEEPKTSETKKDELKVDETKTEDTKIKNNNKPDQNSKDSQAQKENESTTVSNKAIPQTGGNDNSVIFGIILFSIIGIFSFVKYKKED